MTSKKAEKKTQKKQGADQGDKALVADKKGKVSRKAVALKPAETPRPEPTPATTDPNDETVVFAFRLLRSERDILHAATGSAKASKFVKAIVLAGARGDMKAVQEIVEEIHAAKQ